MGSGKTTVIDTLKTLGYKVVTLSDMVREEAAKRGVPDERESLMEVGQSLRNEFGTGILARRALDKIEEEGGNKWVIDGIRNPAEIQELKKNPTFIVIANTAPEDAIVERILSRKRSIDSMDEDQIRKELRREMGEGEPEDGQQLRKCIEMADHIFENIMPLEDVENEFLKFYNQIPK